MAKTYRTMTLAFWTDPDLCRLPFEYTVMYGVLINLVDDEGRLEDDPRMIWQKGMALRPGVNPVVVHKWLDDLQALGKIVRYNRDGISTIAICTWKQNQKVPHALASVLPAPPRQLLREARKRRHQSHARLFSPHPKLLPEATVVDVDEDNKKLLETSRNFMKLPVHETSRNFRPEGKGGGREDPCPSESFQDSSEQGRIASDAPLEERCPEEFKALWKRTKNAIRRYEALVPDGKPVTPEEALEYEEAIGKARQTGGPHLLAIEHYASRVYERFATEGIMYAGKPLGQGQFGKYAGKPKKRRKKDEAPYDGRRGE